MASKGDHSQRSLSGGPGQQQPPNRPAPPRSQPRPPLPPPVSFPCPLCDERPSSRKDAFRHYRRVHYPEDSQDRRLNAIAATTMDVWGGWLPLTVRHQAAAAADTVVRRWMAEEGVREGVAQAERGELTSLGSFAQYADDNGGSSS